MYHAALAEFNQARQLCPDEPEPYFYLGHTYWRLDLAEQALTAFEYALRLNPDDTQLLLDAGTFCLDCGQESKAKVLIERACGLSNNTGLNFYGQAHLAYSRKDYPEALRQFQGADEWLLDRPYLSEYVGITLMQLKRYQEAREALQKSVLRPEPSASSLYNLALCEMRLHNDSEARKLLEQAATVDPYDYSVYAALAGIHFRRLHWKTGFHYTRLSYRCYHKK